jgi:alpha-glucosidase
MASAFFPYQNAGQKVDGLSLTSFDSSIRASFFLDEGGDLNYEILYKGKEIIRKSQLRINVNGHDVGEGCSITNSYTQEVDGAYDFPFGKSSRIRNQYREGTLTLISGGITFDIILRVYDDGVAFKYRFPQQEEPIRIEEENSRFNFASDLEACAMEIRESTTPTGYLAHSYEGRYEKKRISDITSLTAMPMLVRGDGFCAAITEAALKDYAGASLLRGEGLSLVTHLAGKVVARQRAPFTTPWRVVMLGGDEGALIESNLLMNLNERCAIEDISWIEPGKAVWPWWTAKPTSVEVLEEYTDFASKHGIRYLVIDAGWYCDEGTAWNDPLHQNVTKPVIDLQRVLSYAKSKNVKVILWVHGATLHNQLDEALAAFESWGISGIKVDDYGREDQEWVNFWWEVAEKAAQHRMVVDFHGTYKPTGLRRAYPNVLTSEAVLGLEYTKWSDNCTIEHQVTIPYTRMLAGPMDFTPGAVAREWFGDDFRVEGTVARQLAMYVVYESPLQMLVDYPQAYECNRDALSFLEEVPTVWDETRFMGGEVGKYVILARKSGEDWFVGLMNDGTPRRISVRLDFLAEGKYLCELYTDSKDPLRVNRTDMAVRRGDSLEIDMPAGGGSAVRIRKSG